MILCKKCGNSNPLGRVFCGTCGSKLDLSGLSSETVAEITRRPLVSLRFLKILWLLLLAPIIIAALAFWPDSAPIGRDGTRLGMQRVEGSLHLLADVKKGRTLGREFTEEDVNGYFKFDKAAKLQTESISVQAFEGYIQVRVVRALSMIRLGSVEVVPRVSYDLFCVPMGSLVRVSKVRMGHLSWLGPMKTSVVRSIYRMASSQKEWAVFGDMTELKLAPGKITVVLTKN